MGDKFSQSTLGQVRAVHHLTALAKRCSLFIASAILTRHPCNTALFGQFTNSLPLIYDAPYSSHHQYRACIPQTLNSCVMCHVLNTAYRSPCYAICPSPFAFCHLLFTFCYLIFVISFFLYD